MFRSEPFGDDVLIISPYGWCACSTKEMAAMIPAVSFTLLNIED